MLREGEINLFGAFASNFFAEKRAHEEVVMAMQEKMGFDYVVPGSPEATRFVVVAAWRYTGGR